MFGLLAALTALLLTACGGGGGSPAHGGASSSPSPARTRAHFGYFQTIDGQIAATSDHVDLVHCQDDSAYGDPSARAWREQQIILCLRNAQTAGIKLAIVSVGFLLFDAHFGYVGTGLVAPFTQQLTAAGVASMVAYLYVLDEPDLHGLDDATMTKVMRDLRSAWHGPKLVVVYSDSGRTPGKSAADVVGMDKYSAGADVLNELPAIGPHQSYVILPGGANPWQTDPQPFVDYAVANADVEIVWPFIFGPYPDKSGTQQGIGTNGELPAYRAAGCEITGKC